MFNQRRQNGFAAGKRFRENNSIYSVLLCQKPFFNSCGINLKTGIILGSGYKKYRSEGGPPEEKLLYG
jgi:hypothetical protein